MLTESLARASDRDALYAANGPDEVAAAERSALVNLMGALEHAPLDALVLAVRQICETGYGSWQTPDQRQNISPATHMVEIHVLGVLGTGPSVEEAARSWRRAALNLVQG